MPSIDDIPIGAENAITRQALMHKWHMRDRTVRETVARFRAQEDDPYIIISHSNGRGYYRTDNISQIEGYVREMDARIRNTAKAVNKARRLLKEAGV